MARLIESLFTEYELNDREVLEGKVLNVSQKMYYKTQLCNMRKEKDALVFDPEKVLYFAQVEAELRGQMNLIVQMLEQSDIAEKELAQPSLL